jgi:ribulose-5-phosphate 4-epimerase/fuculose-1-phosphate aldolase
MYDVEIRDKVAKCTRILTMQGLLGLVGHISIYQAETGRVFISPGFGHDKATTQPKDVLVCDLEGRVLEGSARLSLEWPIHTTLHAARSDAGSVFHLHSPYATAYAIADREFRPVTLQGTNLRRRCSSFRRTSACQN